ncbi:MAG: hypothetical protein ACPG4Z_06835 [Chitinophagales bacterium]
MENVIPYVLDFTYVLIGLALLGTLVGIVLSIFEDLKAGAFAIGGLILIVVLFGAGYAMSSGDIPSNLVAKGIDNVSAFKISGAGLFTFYALAVIAIIALLLDIVKGFVDGN